MWKQLLVAIFLLLIAVGCAANEAQNSEPTYEETKKMLVDILKTDDGKKAIKDVLTDDSFKQKLIMEQDVIKTTIVDTLVSEEGKDFWKEQLKDPKFSEALAKSMEDTYKNVLKKLMADPDYQEKMITLLQNPDMEKQFLTLFKSKEYRSHLQTVITETFENPIYKAKLTDIIKSVTSDAMQESQQENGGGQSEGEGEEQQSGSGS